MTTITIDRALLEQILNDVCGAKLCEVNSMSSRADQTMTDKFKRWFAGSKVVDADGKPLVVYHGTDQKFTEFKYGEFGFHFGNKEQAESRGDVLMPVYLSIKNPIHFDTDFSSWNEEEIAPYLVKKKIITRKEAGLGDLQGLLMEKGYDGYLYENGYEGGGTSYAVFSPEQIKSAIGNNGDFDPKNPDIRFSRAEVRRLMGSAANAIRAALAPPATAPEPSWHDAPTCAGVWLCDEGDICYTWTANNIEILDKFDPVDGLRWFGPIPEDKP